MVDEHVNVLAWLGSEQSSSWWMEAERMPMKGGERMFGCYIVLPLAVLRRAFCSKKNFLLQEELSAPKLEFLRARFGALRALEGAGGDCGGVEGDCGLGGGHNFSWQKGASTSGRQEGYRVYRFQVAG